MVLSSPITSSDAERTTSVHQRRGSGASVRSGTGDLLGRGKRKKRDSSVPHSRAKVAHVIAKRNSSVPKMPEGATGVMRGRAGRAAQAVEQRPRSSGDGGAGRAAQAV